MGFGWMEMLVIMGVVLLVFGPKRLPELARGIGQSLSEIKKGMRDVQDEVREPMSTLEEEATGWTRTSPEQLLDLEENDSDGSVPTVSATEQEQTG